MKKKQSAGTESAVNSAERAEACAAVSSDGKECRLPRINFRIFLFCALSLAFGIFLYTKIRFGGLAVSDFLFIAFFLFFAFQPLCRKRALALVFCLFLFAGAGVLSVHVYTQNYLSGMESGKYEVTGVVESRTLGNGYVSVELSSLTFDGRSTDGKLRALLNGDGVRYGDMITFTANVSRNGLPSGDFYNNYDYGNDVRYSVSRVDFEKSGTTGNLLLRLKSDLYDTLHSNLGRDEADLCFSLLTGDTGSMDGSLKEAVQRGGIAHLFAVSGLHIGIFFAAVLFVCKPLGKYSVLPALGMAVLYSAFCGFTVSSIRAVIMCGVLGANKLFGRKTDLLQSLSFAAILVLLAFPAQWLTAGFRLSFGAVIGLALFSGSFSRGLKRLHVPAFLGNYLAASIAVQLSTLPVLLECFGYFPVWGLLLNLFLIPLMPVLFPLLFVCSLLALCIPPAAFFFLRIPAGIVSLLPFLFSAVDFSFVLTGFSLGAGSVVWLTGTVALSERFRLKRALRAMAAGVLCLLFAVCLTFENVVFTGCRIDVEGGEARAALVRTNGAAVLVIDGSQTLSRCTDFLANRYGGTLDAVVVLSDDELDGVNVGAFLPAKAVYAKDEIATGLQETEVRFGDRFTVNGLEFRYESRKKLVLLAEGAVVEFDFSDSSALGADLFIEKGSGGLKYFLKDGIIRSVA